MEIVKIKKRQRLSSLLGLTLDGSRIEGVVLRRPNGSLQIQQSFSATLSLDPLTADAELVGREIRNQLDAAGIRERNCVIGLPLKWALTTHVETPKLEEADLDGFLDIEAERTFPCDLATLLVSRSHCQLAEGKQYVTLVGIPRNHVERLEQVLVAAKLKPVSFSLGLPSMQPAQVGSPKGVLALAIGEKHVALQVTAGGGIASLRVLEGALELEGGREVLQADVVAREVRITLGQLPAELRDSVRQIRVFGARDLARQLADEVEQRLGAVGLKVEVVTRYAPAESGPRLEGEAPVSAALSLAAAMLAEQVSTFEYLPPKVTRLQQLSARYSSSKLRTAGALAAVVVVLVVGAFVFQQVQLMVLKARWNGMAADVKNIKDVQAKYDRFRPWSHISFPSLSVLKVLAQSFPEKGDVSAKTVELRDVSTVTCSGLASDIPAVLAVIDNLRTNKGVYDVRQPTVRGTKPPMQFTFEFKWNERAAQ
jgi:hypothetical protein